MLRVISKWIEMPDRPAVFRQPRRLDAGNLLQVDAQVVRVLASARGFLHQLVELLHKNHSLELLHPIVAAASEERLCALEAPGGASDVVERVAPVQEFIAVAGDGAAFSGGDMLGVLETETGQVAECAALAAFVFSQPSLTGILDNAELVFAGEDRKSTRLNSSHTVISYAVFCLKKKKEKSVRTSPLC